MSATTEPKGFRRDIMVLHAVSELMEKHPALPRPSVIFDATYKGEQERKVSWYIHSDYDVKPEGNYWDLGITYEEWDTEAHDLRRVDIERRIAELVDALEAVAGGPVEWEKNDPTKEEYNYTLRAEWCGAKVRISTSRDAVCEKVIVSETEREEEVPDPELHETFLKAVPKVKVTVKDTITEWQCNSALAERTAPVHIRKVSVL